MSTLNLSKLQGISQTNLEITVPTNHKLIIPGRLRAGSIQSISGIDIWSSDAGGNIFVGGSLSSSNGNITSNTVKCNQKINLPVWTTSTRPTTNLVSGLIGYNSVEEYIDVYDGTTWRSKPAASSSKGLSSSSPALNAAEISASGIRTDGDYWYSPAGYAGSALQLYTNFSQAPAGTGYVLVARGRESTDWWNNSGQNTANLSSSTLNNNTPIAVAPSDFVNRLIGQQWNGMKFLTNRMNSFDSWLFTGSTNTNFSWSYFAQSASSVNATAVKYNKLWNTAGIALNWGSSTSWTDTFNYGGSNNCDRTFTWSWSGHGSWQGWSGGSECNPAGSFQQGGEGHSIQLVNCYVQC